MSHWDQAKYEDLLRRMEAAGPLDRTGPETAAAALEERVRWLGRAWPGTTRTERLGPALDDLPQHQRDELAADLLGGLNDPEDHDHDHDKEK